MPAARSVAPAAALLLLLCAATAATARPAHAAPPPPSPYTAPVSAPVVDGFRPPDDPWGPGNRGVDYATEPGTPVVVAAAGQVVFAGAVGGALHVTVRHPDGLRTSYSFLAGVQVALGQVLAPGTVIGVAGAMLHLGVRDVLGRYLDPLGLLDRPGRAVLVPGGDDGARSDDPAAEARALLGTATDGWRRWGSVLPPLPGPASMLAALGPAALAHQVAELSPVPHLERIVDHVVAQRRRPCTPGDQPAPGPDGARIAVLVGGFGSTSEGAAADDVDVEALGYDPDDVLRFSYRGGRTPPKPGVHGRLADLPASTYDALDSQGDLPTAGDELALLLEQVAAARPGVPIDVIAHSQGGVVTRLALDGAALDGTLPEEVDAVVTLATPHQGADLATAAASASTGPHGHRPLELLRRLGSPVDPSRPAVAQLSEVSPVIDRLASAGVPAGVRLTTVGARGDLTVPAGRTVVPGAAHVVVRLAGPRAHDALPGSPEATREIALAVAGMPPSCESLGDVVADAVIFEGVSWVEDGFGVAAGAVARSA